jgi:hypothetical protein
MPGGRILLIFIWIDLKLKSSDLASQVAGITAVYHQALPCHGNFILLKYVILFININLQHSASQVARKETSSTGDLISLQ